MRSDRARQRRSVGLLLALAALATVCGVAGANQAPMAEAGLDQTVDVETTVYLDAGGSGDPDGTLSAVAWNVTAPNGSAVPTDCSNCTRTTFTPSTPGRYEATVAVTDDAGATGTDALYVTALAVEPPEVAIEGPEEVTVGTTVPYRLVATAGDAPVRTASLSVNGSEPIRPALGDDANATVNRTFDEVGTYRLRATVRDADGFTGTATRNVSATDGAEISEMCGFIMEYAESVGDARQDCSNVFDDDLNYRVDGEQYGADIDGDGDITLDENTIEDNEQSFDQGFGEAQMGMPDSDSSTSEMNRSPRGF